MTIESKKNDLITSIKEAFQGVQLGDGVSWREADVIDDYGSLAERKIARDKDEKENWLEVPADLIEHLRYQSVICFLDTKGLIFYLPICMLLTLERYTTTESMIYDSLQYQLSYQETISKLKAILSPAQLKVVINFLTFCLDLDDDYLDIPHTKEALKKWLA